MTNVLRTLAFIAILGLGDIAVADGFICRSPDLPLGLQVYNSVATPATRRVEILVVSDLSRPHGERTLARFTRRDGNLTGAANQIHMKVDAKVKQSLVGTETLGDWNWQELDAIGLHVEFTYANPVKHGGEVLARLEVIHASGKSQSLDLVCRRYLKGG